MTNVLDKPKNASTKKARSRSDDKFATIRLTVTDKKSIQRIARSYRGLKMAQTVNLLLTAWNSLTPDVQKQMYLTPPEAKESANV